MLKELYNENRSRLVFAFIILLVLILLSCCGLFVNSYLTNRNDSQIEATLNTITYSEDSADSEFEILQKLTELKPISAETQGTLYKALAEISYMSGDDMQYNNYIAYALFYLSNADDTESVVYLNNKYIGRLYANGCYNSAEQVLNGMSEKYDISLVPLSLQSAYYLSYADVEQMLGNDEQDCLSKAQSAINLMTPGGSRSLDQAKYDILKARSYINKGDFTTADEIMAKYSENDDFGLGANQVYVVCDFRIPYYEITAKSALYNKDFDTAYYCIDKYLDCCDSYHFRTMKLNLLQYVVAQSEHANQFQKEKYTELEKSVSQSNLDEMTDEYGRFLLTDIDNITEQPQNNEQQIKMTRHNLIAFAVFLYVALLFYCGASLFLSYMNKDGLTRLNNRKKYEQIRIVCEKKKTPYCLIMIDIDDFKKVNDTFGHACGDSVLRSVANIMRSYGGRGISSYRYGGEEMCMVLLNVSEKRTYEIAEEIRSRIEMTVGDDNMRVTVSGGVGVSLAGENVFQTADQNLYKAKSSGKNMIK